MKHISEIIENILVEWAYRVHDGMPNPKNAQHIQQLRESMEELNLPNKVIYEVIQNLINEEDYDEEKEHLNIDGGIRIIKRRGYLNNMVENNIKQGERKLYKKRKNLKVKIETKFDNDKEDKSKKIEKEDDSGKSKTINLYLTEKNIN